MFKQIPWIFIARIEKRGKQILQSNWWYIGEFMESREKIGFGVYFICNALGNSFEKWGNWWDFTQIYKKNGADIVRDFWVVENDVHSEWKEPASAIVNNHNRYKQKSKHHIMPWPCISKNVGNLREQDNSPLISHEPTRIRGPFQDSKHASTLRYLPWD